MVRHLGTSPTNSLQPLTSLPGFVSVLRTDSNFSYLTVDLTRTAVGPSSLLVRRYEIRYLTYSETRRVVQTVLFYGRTRTAYLYRYVWSGITGR